MEINKSGRVFGIYDSIKEIPAGRLLGFQVQLTQHNSIGSTFEELDASQARLDAFLSAGRVQDAIDERKNQRLGFWLMFNNLNTSNITLANLVKSIDGVPVIIRTDDDALKVAKLLEETDISAQEVEDLIEKIKKKLNSELRLYLPEMFQDNMDISVAADVVQQALLKIEHTLGRADREKEISELENRMLDTIRPLVFEGDRADNYQVQAEKSFEELCALLISKGVHNPHEVSAFQFYLNIQLLSKMSGGKHQRQEEFNNYGIPQTN